MHMDSGNKYSIEMERHRKPVSNANFMLGGNITRHMCNTCRMSSMHAHTSWRASQAWMPTLLLCSALPLSVKMKPTQPVRLIHAFSPRKCFKVLWPMQAYLRIQPQTQPSQISLWPLSVEMLRKRFTCRVGQKRIFTPYMTVYLVISLPIIPYTHLICMVLANLIQP